MARQTVSTATPQTHSQALFDAADVFYVVKRGKNEDTAGDQEIVDFVQGLMKKWGEPVLDAESILVTFPVI